MSGPRAPPAPAKPAQIPMALARSWGGNTLLRIESVVGMIRAAPAPATAAEGDQLAGAAGEGGAQRGQGEDGQPGLEGALAAEAVADGAGRQEQPGEHEGVGVDDPLEPGLGGVEGVGPGQRRQGHVGRRDGGDDQDEVDAQDAEDQPAAGIGLGGLVGGGVGHDVFRTSGDGVLFHPTC